MERIQVESSNIASIGYAPHTETLEIEFLHGGLYQYYDVPKHVYDELMAADSHGRYFNAYVKPTYNFNKA
jgi:hypothetical protein